MLISTTARDRISLLLDPDSPFLELCAFAGFGLKDSSPCGNLISGIGSVWYVIFRQVVKETLGRIQLICKDRNSGRLCLILSHIPSQSGGAWNEYTGSSQLRLVLVPFSPRHANSLEAKPSHRHCQ
jgi:acetyl-CoA carboxylase carboxyltransferase component